MTSATTRRRLAGPWTASIELLLLLALLSIGSVHSESLLNGSSAAPTAEAEVSPETRPTSESTLGALRNALGNLTGSELEAVVKEGLENSASSSDLVLGSNKPKEEVPEDSGDAERVEEKRALREFQPEFEEDKSYSKIDDLEDEKDSREPTTPAAARKETEENNAGPKKVAWEGSIDDEKAIAANGANNYSLINDTNVNYLRKKLAKERKKDVDYENEDYEIVKSTLESPTNVISFGDDGRPERADGSKPRIRGTKTSTLPKPLQLGESIVATTTEKSREKNDSRQADEKIADGSSFAGDAMTKESRDVEKDDLDKTTGESPENSEVSALVGITEAPGLDKQSPNLKPYPYTKLATLRNTVEQSETVSSAGPVVSESTEEASALENTIGERDDDGKPLVTESSIIIRTTVKQSGLPETLTTSPRRTDENEGTTIFAGNLSVSGATNVVTENNIASTTSSEELGSTASESIGPASDVDENHSDLVKNDPVQARTTLPSTSTLPPPNEASMPTKTYDVSTESSSIESSSMETTPGRTSPDRQTAISGQSASSNGTTEETLAPEGPSISDSPMEPTTSSRVEYEFVGLTESTLSQLQTESTNSSSVQVVDEQSASSTSSPFQTSSVSASPVDIGTTMENEEIRTTPDYPESSLTETTFDQDSTTIDSTTDDTWSQTERMTAGKGNEANDSTITTGDVSSTTETSESTEMVSQNSTSSPAGAEEYSTTPTEYLTESGRSGESSSGSATEMTTEPGQNAGSTPDASTESPDSSIVVDGPRESTMITEPSTSWTETSETSEETEISASTSQSSIAVSTDAGIDGRAFSPEESTSLVRIIFEGGWMDVCPYLPSLRQALADLLSSGLDRNVVAEQIIFQKNPCTDGFESSPITTEFSVTTLLLHVVDKDGNLDAEMTKILPSLYSGSPVKLQVNIRSFQLIQDTDSGNAIAVVVVSCVALICLLLLAGLLCIMRKRQTRFNYGERCRPVSLDAYSLDSVSAYNSVRGRKGAIRASKRSYGNPAFEDSTTTPSHPLNFAGLSAFCNEANAITEEFSGIPQVTARIDELPQGAEVKNRYANVVPLPETRVPLTRINNDPLTEYINASYVRGPKNATKYYIACQAPMESTVMDFWRMIWEQRSKVVIMLTDLVENGVEKCAEYIPPSEVTDCHRLYGDFQVTLKKRETKEKYAISTLRLKNLENDTFKEIYHVWYLWPANGVQSDAAGLIAVLLEARALQRGGPGPVVVHCSPGTGRTGTLIALDLAIRQYEITRTVDVPRVVYTIRRDRAGAVQTKEQYAFVYKALNLYATKLAGGASES